MTQEFKKEIKARKKELESIHSKLTNYWMDGKFESETNANIGRTLDYINKAIEKLNALLG